MTAPDRAFRFVGAGFEARDGAGLAVTAQGGLALVAGDAAVRQAILLLLATSPGERVMRPDYGSHLHRLIFAPNDDTTAGLAIHYVHEALRRWEPRVQVLDVDASADPEDPSRLNIRLDYRVTATQVTATLAISLELRPMDEPAIAEGRLP